MQVAYSGTGGRSPRYACVRGLHLHATDGCQSLGGGRLDKAVAAAFLEAVTPGGVSATAGAVAELEAEHDARLSGRRLAVERAEFEADRARRQFDACEPEHRVVAPTLERALEEHAISASYRARGRTSTAVSALRRPSRSARACSSAVVVRCRAKTRA
jgi:hypothetical protein